MASQKAITAVVVGLVLIAVAPVAGGYAIGVTVIGGVMVAGGFGKLFNLV